MYSITKLLIPLSAATKTTDFVLLGVRAYAKYVEGAATDEIAGYRYTLGDPQHFEQLQVKVPIGMEHQQALFSQDQIEHAKAPIRVRLRNCMIRPYQLNNGSYALSFSAENIETVKA